MGHYTRLTFWAEIDDEAAAAINDWLQSDSLVNEPMVARAIFTSSYYHQTAGTKLRRDPQNFWALNVDASCKDYNLEIQKFLEWVAPHDTGNSPSDFRGFIQYEDAERPTLIFWDPEAKNYRLEWPKIEGA